MSERKSLAREGVIDELLVLEDAEAKRMFQRARVSLSG